MTIGAKVEIHFHQQEQASVYLESTVSGDQERVAEIALVAVLAIRIFSNLGANETSDNLAKILLNLAFMTSAINSGVELIPYPGQQGRKVFVATMQMTSETFVSNVTSTGFNWLKTGYAYYGPVSVLILVQFLMMKRGQTSRPTSDLAFPTCLARTCGLCGELHMARRISPLTNHHQLAADVILESCHHFLSAPAG